MEMWPGQPSRTSQELDGLGLSAELMGAGLETSWSNWSGKTLGTETYINTWLIQEQGYPWPLIQYNSAFLVWPAGSEAFFFVCGLWSDLTRYGQFKLRLFQFQVHWSGPWPSSQMGATSVADGQRRWGGVRKWRKKLFGKTIWVPKGGRLQFWRLTVSKMIWFGGSQSQTSWADLLGFRQALAPISSKLQLVWAEKLGSKPVFPSAFSVASEPADPTKDSDAKHIHHRNPGLVSPGWSMEEVTFFIWAPRWIVWTWSHWGTFDARSNQRWSELYWCVVRGEFSDPLAH